MKKLLSIMLAMAMILSVVIIAAIPTAAIDGDWTVVSQAKQESGEVDENKQNSVAGYEYTSDGFHVISANFAGQNPWARFVSKNKIDLKDGVYMEIRIDEFNYTPGDRWLNVMFWDQQLMTPGDSNYGEGAQFLLRPNQQAGDNYIQTAWATGGFNQLPATLTDVPMDVREDGKHYVTVELYWDEANSTYVYNLNGSAVPANFLAYINEKFGEDSEAYVGFCFQHNTAGENISCTMTKFGTSAETATTPAGDDSKAPIDNSTNFVAAPVVENPTFEAGKPGIFMNADLENSDTYDIPGSAMGETLTVNEDGTMKVVAKNSSTSTGTWVVKNATSYAIEDLPIAMMVTRNLCTCSEEDLADNNGICYASEESTVYLMTGEKLSADGDSMTYAEVSWDAYVVGEDTYLSVMLDASDMGEIFSGRINGVRFDFSGVDTTTPGANTFDICFVAFFATAEDANEYFEAYLTNLGWEDPDAGEDDVTTEEETTVADETTAAGEDETTVAGEDETTVAGGDNNSGSTDTPAKKGCKGVVGFGAVAVVAVATVAGFVSFKKKED